MEVILIPLALFGLFGGLLNLPGYLGGGWLGHFLDSSPGGESAGLSPVLEVTLQAIAGSLAVAGLCFAHYRYGGKSRQQRIEAAAEPVTGMAAFLLNGWRFDDLYRVLFIRPYEWLARILWERVDEGVIDDSLDRLARILGRTGEGLGSWSTGRVSVYLLSMAAGLALMLGYLAWVTVR